MNDFTLVTYNLARKRETSRFAFELISGQVLESHMTQFS